MWMLPEPFQKMSIILFFNIFMENIINRNNILEIILIFSFLSAFWCFMWMLWERGTVFHSMWKQKGGLWNLVFLPFSGFSGFFFGGGVCLVCFCLVFYRDKLFLYLTKNILKPDQNWEWIRHYLMVKKQ